MEAEANEVLNYLASVPQYGRITVTKAILREIMLATDAELIVHARIWDIRSRHVGAGIYKVWLEQRDDREAP